LASRAGVAPVSSLASTSAPESTSTRPSPPPRPRVRRNHPRTAPRPGRLAFGPASGPERGATAVELAVVRSVVQRSRPVLVAVPHRSTVPHQCLHDRRVPVSRCLEQRLSPPRSALRLSRRDKDPLQPPSPDRIECVRTARIRPPQASCTDPPKRSSLGARRSASRALAPGAGGQAGPLHRVAVLVGTVRQAARYQPRVLHQEHATLLLHPARTLTPSRPHPAPAPRGPGEGAWRRLGTSRACRASPPSPRASAASRASMPPPLAAACSAASHAPQPR
jgi:hypothetical protein